MKFSLAASVLAVLSFSALPALARPAVEREPAGSYGHLSSVELEAHCSSTSGQKGSLFVIEYDDGSLQTIDASECFSTYSSSGALPSVIRSCQKATCYISSEAGCKPGHNLDPKDVGPDFILRGDGPILHQFGTSLRCHARS